MITRQEKTLKEIFVIRKPENLLKHFLLLLQDDKNSVTAYSYYVLSDLYYLQRIIGEIV